MSSKSRPTTAAKDAKSRPTTAKDLPPKELEQLREAFRMFDKNNEGRIGIKELGEVLKVMGLDPSDTELQGESAI
jgi:Ca2+-binding EF-hand superfamily protein